MDVILAFADLILHVDRHLTTFVATHGAWVYALLFAIVFVETGVVVMPFLPGDSLLFVVGTLCGAGVLDFWLVAPLLAAAAIAGDQMNYGIGRRVGRRVFGWSHSRLFNRRAFDQAHALYERHGGIIIVLARFLPFVRTFAPFVAGVAEMDRRHFALYNCAGALLWVLGLTLAGFLFGNIPWVQANLNLIIWGLVLVPGCAALYGGWRARRAAAPAR